MIDHPSAKVDKLMEFLPGPDFPTGAIVQGRDEIKKPMRLVKVELVRSKTEIEKLKGGKSKSSSLRFLTRLIRRSWSRKSTMCGSTIRWPALLKFGTNPTGTVFALHIELKKDANTDLILNYLFKYTDLQVNYNFNMVAIDNFTPRLVGIVPILTSYIAHRKEIILARSRFDKAKAEKRLHIVEGLIRVISILDEVIALIRAPKTKQTPRKILKLAMISTEEQAEAIVTLQLYRLTNTDVVVLEEEEAELREKIAMLAAIIGDERTMYNLMKRELRDVKKKFGNPRLSELQDTANAIEIDTASLIVEEETYVSVTRSGYIKRTSPRSFSASTLEEMGKRDDDRLIFVSPAKTTQHLLIFTSLGMLFTGLFMSCQISAGKKSENTSSQTISNFDTKEEVIYTELLTV